MIKFQLMEQIFKLVDFPPRKVAIGPFFRKTTKI